MVPDNLMKKGLTEKVLHPTFGGHVEQPLSKNLGGRDTK